MTNHIEGRYDARDWFGVVTLDGRTVDPRPSQGLRNHSPSGFAWGYNGSGPAQLALAILLAAGVRTDLALRHYQDFKNRFVAPLDRATFTLNVDVVSWVSAAEAARGIAEVRA